MDFWINKRSNVDLPTEYRNAYVISITRKGASTAFSSIFEIWRRISDKIIDTIYEDLFIIGLSIYSIDTRVQRWGTPDNWTRDLKVSIPVLDYNKWNSSVALVNKMASFLTGDRWDITFRSTEDRCAANPCHSRFRTSLSECNLISLFSGGLDSFCGAIYAAQQGYSPCLVGHNEYPKLKAKQQYLINLIKEDYPERKIEFIDFTAKSHAPSNLEGDLPGSENTLRGRSLLFLCAAVSLAGIISPDTPVFIPENGFIGINIPLTSSRRGSCSTRTTHPFFLDIFKQVLKSVEINNDIYNPFMLMTKRELVGLVANKESFRQGFDKTISCSHPCNPRYNRDGNTEYPKNCGYCYPCLIRKSSLLDIAEPTEAYTIGAFGESIDDLVNQETTTSNDVKAVLSAVHRYHHISDAEIAQLIRSTGPISSSLVAEYARLYKSTMGDLSVLFNREYGYEEKDIDNKSN